MFNWLSSFWRQPNRRYRNFVIVYTLLALNFLIPAASYYIDAGTAIDSFYGIGERFGYKHSASEDSYIWWVLGAGNVMTLGVMCTMLLVNLRRFYPVLPALVTLKGLSSLGFLVVYIAGPHNPTFLAAALLDGVTVALMLWFAIRAHRSIGRDPEGLVPRPIDGRRLLRVGGRSRKRIANVAAAIVPGGASQRLPHAASHEQVMQSIVEQIEGAPLQAGLGLKIALRFIHAAPFLIIGRPHSLSGLSQKEGERYLTKLEHNRSYILRQLTNMVKSVVCLAYMGNPTHQGFIGAYKYDAITGSHRL